VERNKIREVGPWLTRNPQKKPGKNEGKKQPNEKTKYPQRKKNNLSATPIQTPNDQEKDGENTPSTNLPKTLQLSGKRVWQSRGKGKDGTKQGRSGNPQAQKHKGTDAFVQKTLRSAYNVTLKKQKSGWQATGKKKHRSGVTRAGGVWNPRMVVENPKVENKQKTQKRKKGGGAVPHQVGLERHHTRNRKAATKKE